MLQRKISGSGSLSTSLSGGAKISGSLSMPDAKTMDYEALRNLPKINSVELKGNKQFEELGLQEVSNIEIDNLFRTIFR
jgi:hypothetical protein